VGGKSRKGHRNRFESWRTIKIPKDKTRIKQQLILGRRSRVGSLCNVGVVRFSEPKGKVSGANPVSREPKLRYHKHLKFLF